ncbi:hypothetical protein EXIGLDRAFT_828751 [Exidia glandulosa HHB12029]|uniref:Uncharacterized protein n=1 Tax=Exidia glandulosa HHB12029 TaxID=1314781 RepID=A0A166BPK5_EXIGL|nr:hypothetical protein EXIGLDRAFT_828751 [Exidia glandulosa HHB12029]
MVTGNTPPSVHAASVSSQRAAAIRDAIRDILHDNSQQILDAEPDAESAMEKLKQSALDVVHDSFKEFAEHHNDRRARVIQRLPTDLLASIFEEFLPLSDCIAITHVCQAWRDLLLCHSPLSWSAIDGKGLPRGALAELLSRSASADLRLKVCIDSENWEESSICIHTHLWRCTYLKVTVTENVSTEGAHALLEGLCRPAPRLRTFKFFDDYLRLNALQSGSLFDGQAPNLRLLKFCADIRQIGHGDIFRNVTRLVFARPLETTIEDVAYIASCFPQLQALAIDLDDWKTSTSPEGAVPVVLPASLTDLLIIWTNSSSDPLPLLSRLEHRSIPRLQVRHRYLPDAEAVEELLQQVLPSKNLASMSLYPSGIETSLNLILSDKGKDFALNDERVVTRIPRWTRPRGFDRITSLALGESVFVVHEDNVSLPLLTQLTILMLERDEYAMFAEDSAFLWPRSQDESLTFSCPELRLLRIRAGAADNTCVAPEVIHEFATCHLEYAAPSLQRLELCGVDLLAHVPGEVAKLVALADDFQIVPARPWELWGVEDICSWE